MKPDISVIMPCFNAAPWIGPAIESVLLQAGPSWELLVIDDGSTDASPAVARRYAALDGRVRALPNEGAKGVSGARNAGLAAAKGEAVMFLDSDDALLPGALDRLHAALRWAGAPLVKGATIFFCVQRQLAGFMPDTDLPSSVWGHIYWRDFLREHKLLFPEDLACGEDLLFISRAYARASSVPAVEAPVNIYRINHKRITPSVRGAISFLASARRVRATLEENGRRAWVEPYLAKMFLPEWPAHLYAMRQAGEWHERWFLAHCRALTKGLDPAFGAPFDKDATLPGPEPAAPFPYMGITRSPEAPGWLPYILPRRAANPLRSSLTAKTIAYLARLRLRCQIRCWTRTAGKGGAHAA